MPEHSMQTMMPKLVDNQVASEKEKKILQIRTRKNFIKLHKCTNVIVKQKLLLWSLTRQLESS